MFSNFIQNLLTSSSESAAMMRASQMNANINRLYPNTVNNNVKNVNLNGIPANPPQSFNEVLKSTLPQNIDFGQLLLNPRTKSVEAKLYNPQNVTDINQSLSQIYYYLYK